MAAVNYERVVLRLKEHVLSRRSHGQDALLQAITRLELECEVPEGEEGFSDLPLMSADGSSDRATAMTTR